MAKRQTGKIKVKCNVCGKETEVATSEYYKSGGLRGGCCKTPGKNKDGGDTYVLNTWSTVQVK